MSDIQMIRSAWHNNQKRRPFKMDAEILSAITPPGGEWRTVAERRRNYAVSEVECHGGLPSKSERRLAGRCGGRNSDGAPRNAGAGRCLAHHHDTSR